MRERSAFERVVTLDGRVELPDMKLVFAVLLFGWLAVVAWSLTPHSAKPLAAARVDAPRPAVAIATSVPKKPPAPTPADDDAWWTPVTVRTGEHFRVACNFANDQIAAAALDAAESAWPATLALVGEPDRPVGRMLDVRVLKSRSDYKAADADTLYSARLLHCDGWANYGSRTAYVTLDHASVDVIARAGPGSLFTGTVAHEAAHLVAGLCFGASGECPWFDEGIAACVEEQVLARRCAIAATPRFSGYMQSCRGFRGGDLLPDPSAVLKGRLDSFDCWGDHAVAWAFFRYLNEPAQRERMKALLVAARRCVSREGFRADLEEAAVAVWGRAGLDAMSDGWREYVNAFAPEWEEVGHSVDVSGSSWVQVAGAGAQACDWRTARTDKREYRIVGAFEILRLGSGHLSLLLGRNPPRGGIAVALRAGAGVGVFAWSGTTVTWLAFESTVLPAVGARTRFEIVVGGDEIRVALDGREVVRAPLGGRDVSGAWGIEAINGSAAIWDGVRLE